MKRDETGLQLRWVINRAGHFIATRVSAVYYMRVLGFASLMVRAGRALAGNRKQFASLMVRIYEHVLAASNTVDKICVNV